MAEVVTIPMKTAEAAVAEDVADPPVVQDPVQGHHAVEEEVITEEEEEADHHHQEEAEAHHQEEVEEEADHQAEAAADLLAQEEDLARTAEIVQENDQYLLLAIVVINFSHFFSQTEHFVQAFKTIFS